MPFVIAQPCVGTCDAACVNVCPVDCIHGPVRADVLALPSSERTAAVKGLQLYIDPSECISCGVCEPECPVDAIYEEDDLPAKWAEYKDLNAGYFDHER